MTENSKYEKIILNLKIYGVLGTVIFGLMILSKLDWTLSFAVAFGFSSFIFLIVYFKDTVGIKRHKAFIDTPLSKILIEKGFIIETNNKYYGLKGNYKNATLRIYYDWDKQAESFFSFGDLVINSYYEPIYNSAIKEPNFEKLEVLNSKFSFIKWVRKKRNFSLFSTGYFIRQLNYSKRLTIEKVFSEVDFSLNEISKVGLKLINEETLEKYQNQYGEIYLPFIETYRQKE